MNYPFNGKNSEAVENEWQKNVESDITFKKMWFTWINKEVPYQEIREKIKKHSHNNELVSQFRRDSEVKNYYCFFDADTVDFNEVLSSYIDVIIEHIYPTVMSTGFLFPEQSKFRKESERDRQVRITTAEHFPLGTYYPEPNFCVLLPDGCDTIPERFTNTEYKQMNMESPVLIRQVKRREGFSAVFSNKNPIITLDSNKNIVTPNHGRGQLALIHTKSLTLLRHINRENLEMNMKKTSARQMVFKSLC